MASAPVVQWGSTPEALDDVVQVLALCPSVLPMLFSSFVPDDAVHRWLAAALPLAIASEVTESLAVPVNPAVIPVLADVAEAAPMMKKARKSAKATGKTLASDRLRQQQQRQRYSGFVVALVTRARALLFENIFWVNGKERGTRNLTGNLLYYFILEIYCINLPQPIKND